MNKVSSVIVVDDDIVLCNLLHDALVMNGFACKTAINGKAAIELMNSEKFDFMVTDVAMPGMSGFELTAYVKKHHPGMEVIMMTGFSQEDSCQKALDSGAADFITKPFELEEMVARIKRVKHGTRALEEMKEREHAIVNMSREMIDSIQEEALKTQKTLQEEIERLGGKIAPTDKKSS